MGVSNEIQKILGTEATRGMIKEIQRAVVNFLKQLKSSELKSIYSQKTPNWGSYEHLG